MAFDYEYLMVHLPELCPSSFLLFVHNPAGSTKLRDYSDGRERQLRNSLTVAEVLAKTSCGCSRFYYDPHKTDGEGVGYWTQVTQELNRRWLSVGAVATQLAPIRVRTQPASSQGRATRGSRRQLQDYVNDRPDVLTQAVLAALPARVGELGGRIRWVSPLVRDNYQEYRDGDFLNAIGVHDGGAQLAEFWPAMGPCWDALGIVSDPFGRLRPGAVLIEAKSHIPEIYGSGCQAAGISLDKIERALMETKQWLGVETGADWRGPLYQYANRLAHLYFLFRKLGKPTWLVNLYFVDDPIGPTAEKEWRAEIQNVKAALGISGPVPNAVDVFLAAGPSCAEKEGQNGVSEDMEEKARPAAVQVATELRPAASDPAVPGFRAWSQQWIELACFSGPRLENPAGRIERLSRLWKEPVPGAWQRSVADTPARLLDGRRYTRGDGACPRNGEHKIEHEILCEHFDEVACLDGSKLIDGVNAFPLVRDSGGGRNGNVEADLLLLVQGPQGYRVLVVEVKDASDNAWYAAVESLRQLKLLVSGEDACQLFRQRNPSLRLTGQMPITGIVLAPRSFYTHPGQKANAVGTAQMLVHAVCAMGAPDLRLCVWDVRSRKICPFA
jgi:hypothetical protein